VITVSWKKLSRVAFAGMIFMLLAIGSPKPGKAITPMVNCKDLAYSFSEDFVTQGPVPPDGNPIISDGDLIGANCSICARNADLLTDFDIDPTHDLGLDAVDIIDVDGNVVAFSTELDSSIPGIFTSGDLLVTKGTLLPGIVIIPNQALTHAFNQGAIRVDLGLDAVHFIGQPGDIIEFLFTASQNSRDEWLTPDPGLLMTLLNRYEIDIWFSTEGTYMAPIGAIGFLDGDAISARNGWVVAYNYDLLPSTVPAGIPLRGVDFGLDALTNNRLEDQKSIHFSTEILYQGETGFNDGDVLIFNNGIVFPAKDLVLCFEPHAEMLGLDALYLGGWQTNTTYLPVIISPLIPD